MGNCKESKGKIEKRTNLPNFARRYLKNPNSQNLSMASRFRSLATPTISLIKSTITKPSIKPRPAASFTLCSSPTLSRSIPQLGSLQSLLPLHSAVSSARLTSCLGIDSLSSRSLSQELGLCVPR
ncbi:protein NONRESPONDING TO OXYLIPINS 2, mitochondrial isoform X2 [Cucumis melo]|uniref:Protein NONRESPONDING TO OXYLIPINS 2, mitochondrial isoform X2 n=1 Tax=Cucumis melo TaxID=3656 RepID=A0A1S3CQD0_CUCME|nr:protein NONRESPONDING TO OXYLIPINS 2, mitochondrial isoform X2 [Cucumis melo]